MMGKKPGRAMLRSQAHRIKSEFQLNSVAAQKVDGYVWAYATLPGTAWEKTYKDVVRVIPTADNKRLCAATMPVQVRTTTPTICKLRPGKKGPAVDSLESADGYFRVQEEGYGWCKIVIALVVGGSLIELGDDASFSKEYERPESSDWD